MVSGKGSRGRRQVTRSASPVCGICENPRWNVKKNLLFVRWSNGLLVQTDEHRRETVRKQGVTEAVRQSRDTLVSCLV